MANDDNFCLPLFCTAERSLRVVNVVLQSGREERLRDTGITSSWVFVASRTQTSFDRPYEPSQNPGSSFIGASVGELGFFCKLRFGKSGSIESEDFAAIDKRSIEDQTLLLAQWEKYTLQDDAILRILWGDATSSDMAWLQKLEQTPEYHNLIHNVINEANADHATILPKVEESDSRGVERFDKALSLQKDAKLSSTGTVISSPPETDSMMEAGSRSEIEILEGWRTVRVPIATALRDFELIG